MECHRLIDLIWRTLAWAAVVVATAPVAYSEVAQPSSATPTAALPTTITDKPEVSPLIRAFRNDAALNHIFFINQTTGWAVGDRGVIWHTSDAGSTWREQPSPVSCSLNDVFFINARRGWAVGGQSQPYSNSTRAVMLRTDDGGRTWSQLSQPLLPKLIGIKFFDANQGIAFGQSASYYPSGVFNTRDGGLTWQPLPSDQAGAWLTGDFLAPDAGAVAGAAGQLATLVRHKVVTSPLATTSLRSIRAMQLVAPTGGWAVGDGGLVLSTADLGRSWQTPSASPLQRAGESLINQFDFTAVAVQADHVWIAGSPGTCIFYSPDAGKSWQSATTGQTAPLRSIQFVDAKNGWAAGDFGNILVTHDGGQSWQPQRSGAKRTALLAIFAKPTDVPLEVLADCGAADGYIAAVNILCNSNETDGEVATATVQRAHESFLLAGAATATTAWQFPLPAADLAFTSDDLLEALNRENDGQAVQQLEKYLVRLLRTYRPDVVVTHDTSSWSRVPASPQLHLATLVNQLVMKSIAAAADPTQQTELIADAGLTPWQVRKVYGLTPPGMRGAEAVETARFSPWLGATFADFASLARSLLLGDHTPPPERYEFQLLMSRLGEPGKSRGLFSGISLPAGSEARRAQPEFPVRDLDALRRLALRRRSIEQLLQRSEGNTAWVAQVSQMIDGLSNDDAGKLLSQLAEGYRNTGRLDLAADTYFLLARRAPDHPLADAALNWLVQFYASGEIAHRTTAHSAPNMRLASTPPPTAGEPASAGGETNPRSTKEVTQTSAISPITPNSPPTISLSRDDRLHRAVQLADYLKTSRPALYAEPSVRFAEVVAQRQLGYANPAKRLFISLRQLPESDPWRECAATEEWLNSNAHAQSPRGQGEVVSDQSSNAQLPPAKKLAACRQTDRPPHLDGRLDEQFWQSSDRLILTSSVSAPRSREAPEEGLGEARIAHDDKFIYIAIHCLKAPNVKYEPDDSPRTRDADLLQHDRVSIAFDLDRDYTTAFELTVDDRGWTLDACWGDPTWNPTWYVAKAADENSWTVEAAIPLSELSDRPPMTGDIWAASVRRTIPRTGYQSWAGATKGGKAVPVNSPSQFGLLIFDPSAAAAPQQPPTQLQPTPLIPQ
jgi:photosystem II stability/assembly factor-like uncharacterized protein